MKAETLILLVKNLVFTALVPGSVAFYLPLLVADQPLAWTGAPGQWLALPLLAAGAAIYGWCLWDFAAFGKATPAPIDPPKRLVVRGLYRYVRNPMYVGVLTAVGGWAAFFASWRVVAYGLAVFVMVQLFVLLYEEPVLARKFGAEYADYRSRVGRWLPRLRP